MGYFPNGTSGDMYVEKWCERCQNHGDDVSEAGCAVWYAHMAFNYEQCGGSEAAKMAANVLGTLIPRTDGGLANGMCRMFRQLDADRENECEKCRGTGQYAGGMCICIGGRKAGA